MVLSRTTDSAMTPSRPHLHNSARGLHSIKPSFDLTRALRACLSASSIPLTFTFRLPLLFFNITCLLLFLLNHDTQIMINKSNHKNCSLYPII